MAIDKRYKFVGPSIKSGKITTFKEIVDLVPRKVIYKDLGVNYYRFKRLMNRPQLFTLEELMTLARLFELELPAMFNFTYGEIERKRQARLKR